MILLKRFIFKAVVGVEGEQELGLAEGQLTKSLLGDWGGLQKKTKLSTVLELEKTLCEIHRLESNQT